MVDPLEEEYLVREMRHQNVVERKNQRRRHRSSDYLQVNPGLGSSEFEEDKHNNLVLAVAKGLDWNNASMRNTPVIQLR